MLSVGATTSKVYLYTDYGTANQTAVNFDGQVIVTILAIWPWISVLQEQHTIENRTKWIYIHSYAKMIRNLREWSLLNAYRIILRVLFSKWKRWTKMIYVFIVFWFWLRCTLADLNTQCDTHDQVSLTFIPFI